MKNFQPCIAGTVGLLSALALGATAYLAFVFPKTVKIWMEEERAISAGEKVLVNLGQLCSSFGLLIMPVLLVAVIACIVWAVRSAKASNA